MQEKKKYLDGTAKILLKSQKEKEKYIVNVIGKKFVVYPNVFSPKYFKDTEFFAKNIPVHRGEKFLEIGPGTGIISISAALKGAKQVYAIDINPSAVRNTKENIKIHDLENKITILHGNLFEPLKNKKFDVIFWNTPFGYIKQRPLTVLERAIFDPEYRFTKKFIHDAKKYLAPRGRLIIGFSSTLGHYTELQKILRKEGYKMKLLNRVNSREVHPVKFELIEALPL